MGKSYFIILFILLPLIALSQPQKQYKIYGIVADSVNQKGIPYATITVTNLPEKEIEIKKVTQSDGRFELSIKSIGNYALTISSLGYKTITQNFSITKKQTIYNFGTMPISINLIELNSISIIADKPLVKIESDKLIYSVEFDIEAKTSDALEIIEKVPMLVVNPNGRIQVNGNGNVTIYINGKPSNIVTKNPSDYFQNLPASSIKSIEVITKPGAKYDAEFNGSIINIIMQKKPKGYTYSLNSSVIFTSGLYLRNGLNFTAAIGKFGWSINVLNKKSNNISDKNTYRENFIDNDQKYTYWTGEVNQDWFYLPIYIDFGYEIDTLNLISASFNSSYNKAKNYYGAVVNIKNNNNDLQYSYLYNNSNINFEKDYIGMISYQNISKKDKRKIFTLLYQIDYLPIYWNNEFAIDGIINYEPSKQISQQNELWAEHTFQIDYTFPFNQKSEIESGAKFISRKDESDSHVLDYQYATNQYIENMAAIDIFSYNQNVLAAYLSYKLNIDKLSFKGGIRIEYSKVNSTFTSLDTADFSYSETEFVPNFSISYKFTKSQNLRFSYTNKIRRPSPWHINPYIDKNNPNNFYSGNPNIKTEHYNNFELNYGNYGKFGNLNLGVSYMNSNDGIAREIIQINQETILTTFNNIDKTQKYIVSLSLMLKFGKKIRFRINSSADYNILESTNINTSTKDWGYVLSSNIDYKIIKGLKFYISGFYYQLAKELQTKVSALYSTKLTIKKEFLQSKLNVYLFCSNAFWENISMNYEIFDDKFYQNTEKIRQGYSYGFKISYKFGKIKNQIKSIKKGISNDDIKGRG